MGWNPVNEAKKVFKKLKKEIEDAASKGKRTIEGVVNSGKRTIERVVNEGKHKVEEVAEKAFDEVEKKAKEAGNELEKVGDDIEEGFEEKIPEILTEKLPEILEDATKEAVKAATGPFGDIAVSIMKIGSNGTNKFKLGPVAVTIDDIGDKADTLRGYLLKPPNWKSRDSVMEFVKTVSPSSFSIDASVLPVALVVASSALELKFEKTWTIDEFLEDLDEIIEWFQNNV